MSYAARNESSPLLRGMNNIMPKNEKEVPSEKAHLSGKPTLILGHHLDIQQFSEHNLL